MEDASSLEDRDTSPTQREKLERFPEGDGAYVA